MVETRLAHRREGGEIGVAHLADPVERTGEAVLRPEQADIVPHQRLQLAKERTEPRRPSAAATVRVVDKPLRPGIVLASPGQGLRLALRSETSGALAEHEGLRDRVAGQPVSAVRPADRLAGGEQALDAGFHALVHPNPAHVVMRNRCDLDGTPGQVDSVLRQPVDHGAEGETKLRFRDVLEAQERPAIGRAASRLALLGDGIGGDVARRRVDARIPLAVILDELFHVAIEQAATELVAERIPHDRVHADEPRREVADREELGKLHVDQLGAGVERERIRIAAHIGRCAVAPEQTGKPARGEDHRPCRDTDRRAVLEIDPDRARDPSVMDREIGDREPAYPRDPRTLRDLRP